LAAICSSCVDIRFLLLSVGDVALAQLLDLRRRLPMCAAFPRAEYYQRLRLPRPRRPSYGWSVQSAYSTDHVKTVVDLPGSVTLPCPPVPCSQTPPESPAPSPLAGAYWCLPRVRPCRPPVCHNHEAQSLHLRYGPDVALPTLSSWDEKAGLLNGMHFTLPVIRRTRGAFKETSHEEE
jgi:hypothetical protein